MKGRLNLRSMLLALLALGLTSPVFAQQPPSNPQTEAAEELHKAGYKFFIERVNFTGRL